MYGGVGGGTRESSAYLIMDVSSKRRRRFLPLGGSHDIHVVEGGPL